jgi:GTP-binding protein Era
MKAGSVSFIGRPNAGKSTLLNRIVGQKLAIVSDKPQTTRTRVVGVKNYDGGQIVFVDTPGVHKPTHRMNVRMVDVALEAMREVDVLSLVVDASVKSGPGDRYLLDVLNDVKTAVILTLTKVDLIAKSRLLPLIARRIRSRRSCQRLLSTAPTSTRWNVSSSSICRKASRSIRPTI